ncbi:hypothetical protein C1645_743663 [Glomus cerebriforme]|uniref:Uncharacterized protein n=1 Tax=Glomus cerebriforme TaxID=658196 RepID=A0A397SEE2_9GLOM|nr:hypothetical protein C1645_743663 [Glomus cerebriforme]
MAVIWVAIGTAIIIYITNKGMKTSKIMDDNNDKDICLKYSPIEMHKEELDRLIACYPDGLKQIKKVYLQEVLGIERRNIQDRRTAEVIRTKLKNYNQKKVRKKKTRIVDQPTESAQSVMAESSSKRLLDLNELCPPDITEP